MLYVLKKAEEAILSGKYKSEESPLRTWYDIVYSEQKALADLLTNMDVKPQGILEIGCGPGRIIHYFRFNEKRASNIRIVGYEQNSEISNYCRERFSLYPNITIQSQLVGYESDGRFSEIRSGDRNSFDLILAVSNLGVANK